MSRAYRRSIRLLLVAACGYLAISAALFGCQRALLYHPDTSLADPADVDLPSAALEHLKTPDGEDLVVWWIAPRALDKPVYLYFHGNGGNLTYRPNRSVCSPTMTPASWPSAGAAMAARPAARPKTG
jgi:hypothetical protein